MTLRSGSIIGVAIRVQVISISIIEVTICVYVSCSSRVNICYKGGNSCPHDVFGSCDIGIPLYSLTQIGIIIVSELTNSNMTQLVIG